MQDKQEMMEAVVLRGQRDYGVEMVPVPQCPADGLLIEVKAVGLCGSDLRILDNGHPKISYPWIIGHEVSGRVVEVGPDCAASYETGDLLAVAPVVYCGQCEFCIKGDYEFCDNLRELAQDWHGGFAEYMAVPAPSLRLGIVRQVPEGLDLVFAAVSEPASSCLNAQEKGEIGFGDVVLIIGAGPIGCIHISLARARGAERVIVADIKEFRLEVARKFGADAVIKAAEVDLVERARELTGGMGPDVVITANPVPETQVQAVEMAKKGGRILLFGGLPAGKSKPGIDTNIIHYRGLRVIGTTVFAPRHNYQALMLLQSGQIPADKLVTHRLPLEEFAEGVRLARSGRALKVVYVC